MRTASKLLEVENLNALNFGEALHNNVQATQLKNDLVRNPENAPLLAALKSEDGEIYAQAVKDLGQLAQEKFGLDLSKVDLYDGEKTTSGSLGDNLLTDVKGGTVVDANNQNAGDIFVDAGNGASKTDMANTLGHEILESQDFQGKDSSLTGGLFGKNTDQQQESLANAFGDQFADRINQAAGGDLDSTGGADFSNNLKNSEAVKAGTQKANTVGNARVEHRQANINEATILDKARARINREGTTTDVEKAQALRNLNALACAEIQCASGVSANDPKYKDVFDLQAEGEKLKAETGEDIFSRLDELDILATSTKQVGRGNLNVTNDEFQYGIGDGINDGIDSNEKAIAKAGGVLQSTVGAAGVASGAILTTAGVVACPTGVGCLAAAGGVALTGLGVVETIEGIQKVLGEHEYEGGQRVYNSLSAETHQGEHNAAEDLATDAVIALATAVGSKVGLNKAGDLFDAVKGKLPSGNNGSYGGEDEFGLLNQTPKKNNGPEGKPDFPEIETRYGTAKQSTTPEALAVRDAIENGTPVNRGGTLGKSDTTEGQFWSTDKPDSPGYADRNGIPPENYSAPDFTVSGKVDGDFITREAPGVGTNGGGAIEIVTKPNGVKADNFRMTDKPPKVVPKKSISVDGALGKASDFMKDGVPVRSVDGKTGVQFIQEFTENGQKITKRVGLDLNPNSSHVKQLGPHLNLQTQINGKIQKLGPLADPHIPIDPKTIRPGDY